MKGERERERDSLWSLELCSSTKVQLLNSVGEPGGEHDAYHDGEQEGEKERWD